jgi:hypothetical protein
MRSPVRESDARVEVTRDRVVALFPFRQVVLPFLISRALSDGLIVVMARVAGRDVLHGGFATWDGRWYGAIATHGYWIPRMARHQSPWAFFPLFPAAMRAIASFGVSASVSGIALNHVAFLVGLAGLYRLAGRHTSSRGGSLAVWAAALAPFAFVFSTVYPSAIFFAASVWAFSLVEEHHDLAGGCCAALAVLDRPNGIVVVIALCLLIRCNPMRMMRVAVPSIAGLAAWMLYNLARTGDALWFYRAKAAWREVDVIGFLNGQGGANVTIHVLLALTSVAVVVAAGRRIPRSWFLFSVLYLTPSLALGMVGLGRYGAEIFPPFIAAGQLLERRGTRTRAIVFAVMITAQIACVYWFIATRRVM